MIRPWRAAADHTRCGRIRVRRSVPRRRPAGVLPAGGRTAV